jgi:5-methylcytosine-specific restriction endonuclease McrA
MTNIKPTSLSDSDLLAETARAAGAERHAMAELLALKRPRRLARTASNSRHVPANVKRVVWTRDGGRCAFVGAHGRCPKTGFLELHHVVPFAAGGPTGAENLELRCRAHNAYEATLSGQSSRPMYLD